MQLLDEHPVVVDELHGPATSRDHDVPALDVAVRDVLKTVLSELDHRVLLPGRHLGIYVSAGPKEVEITFADRRWVLPKDDCLVLPLVNTTTELLAEYIGQRLLTQLKARGGARPEQVRIEVSEGTGFSAVWQWGDVRS